MGYAKVRMENVHTYRIKHKCVINNKHLKAIFFFFFENSYTQKAFNVLQVNFLTVNKIKFKK